MNYPEIKKITRKLRNNPPPSEKLLWSYLRKKKLVGRRFLRQHPVIYEIKRDCLFFFVPDFYCKSERMIIEVDGEIHKLMKEKDHQRDLILISCGYKVIRINNDELSDINKVLFRIREEFD